MFRYNIKIMNSGLFLITFYLPGQYVNFYVRSTFPGPIWFPKYSFEEHQNKVSCKGRVLN